MSSCPAEETLAELVEGRLPAASAAELHRHVRGCTGCRVVLAGLADGMSQDEPEPTVEFAHAAPDGETPTDVKAAPDAGPGSVRLELGAQVGRFQIERLIGLGGMGAVYAARDPELGRTVALKLLRLGGSRGRDSEGRRQRMLREAQAMARLSHPNVVTVFQVGEFEDRLFVVMELVEGANLAQWLREAPRTADQILDVYLSAGRGLAAAHAAGIVHRDFKPDNVLVGDDGRVRVTDFGLARPSLVEESPPPEPGEVSDPGRSLTPLGALIGTPAYMAPEQMIGRPADARADVFAFCTSLWEALYGQRPFNAKNIFEMRTRIERGELAPMPRGRSAPKWLRRELLHGLAYQPTERHDSMEELLRALQAGRARAAGRKRWLAVGAGAAVLLLAVAAAAVRRPASRGADRGGARGRRAVAVLGPRDLGGKGQSAWLSEALAEMLGTELGADGRLRLVPAENVARTLTDLGLSGAQPLGRESLSRLRAHLGADVVVTGSYVVSGASQLRVDLRVWDTESGESLAAVGEAGEEERLFELVARAGSQLRRALGGDPLALAHAAQASFPAHPEAARLYAAGLTEMRAFEVAAARQSLTRAAELAPDNPRIHAALSEVLQALGFAEQGREAARKAFESAGGLGRDERLRVERVYRHAIKDYGRAIEIARALWTFFPDDVESGLLLAQEQIAGRQWREALATVQALRKLPAAPGGADLRVDLAEAEAAAGMGDLRRSCDVAAKAAVAARARGARSLLAGARYYEGEALRALADRPAAAQALGESEQIFRALGDRSGAARADTMAATILADDGDLLRARDRFEAAVATFREMGNRRSEGAVEHNLAIISRRLRELPQALEHALKAKDLYDEVAPDRAVQAGTILVIAHIRQDLGLLDEAAAGLQEAVELRRKSQHRLLSSALSALADVRLLQDRLDEARAHYGEALKVARPDDGAQVGDARAGIGRVALAQGRAADALEPLQAAAELLSRASRRDEAALKESDLADALLRLGRAAEAQKAIDAALAHLGTSKSQLSRPHVAVVQARVRATLHPDELRSALQALEAVRAEAARQGVAEEQLQARLAHAELRLRTERAQASADLRALARDARRQGYALLARRAEELSR